MSRITQVVLMVLAVLSLFLAAGCLPFVTISPVEAPPPADSSEIPPVVEEAWEIIFRDYVERDDLDADALSQGAIRGMIEALDDPYTSYLDPEMYQLSLSDLEGNFEGIGAHVTARDEQVVIIAPIPGSPAEQAGIRAGDIILGVNGESTAEMGLAEVVILVRGPRGTTVNLTILHEGDADPVSIDIVRDEIQVASVYSEMREDIAYIEITEFTGSTDDELGPVLESLDDEGATGIILDLRDNPGGMLTTVIDVVSRFVTEGTVVEVVDNQGELTTMSVVRQQVTTDLPMVILVSEFSASGSEVLAGALQDHHRAVVAGKQTFGKGSVNMMVELSDGSGLYLTTGRWLTPAGLLIEGEGILPDYELDLEGEALVQWAIDYLKAEAPVTALAGEIPVGQG